MDLPAPVPHRPRLPAPSRPAASAASPSSRFASCCPAPPWCRPSPSPSRRPSWSSTSSHQATWTPLSSSPSSASSPPAAAMDARPDLHKLFIETMVANKHAFLDFLDKYQVEGDPEAVRSWGRGIDYPSRSLVGKSSILPALCCNNVLPVVRHHSTEKHDDTWGEIGEKTRTTAKEFLKMAKEKTDVVSKGTKETVHDTKEVVLGESDGEEVKFKRRVEKGRYHKK